jgi:cholesterol oxidase
LADYDFDYVIIGSGFGGAVSALRLVERGYSVAVLEMGKRWRKEDFPRTNWNLWKHFWRPALGMYGILQMTMTRDAFFLHGAGVGGGSLVYANTLLVPSDEAFRDPRWVGQDWRATLRPHYATAMRMLGATESQVVGESDRMLAEVAADLGRGDTWKRHTVGVYFGEPGKEVPDPFFDGAGPPRTGCTLCGGCMVGCRVGAKNTLDQNYLYLAERRGVVIVPETRAIDVRPLEQPLGDPAAAPLAEPDGSHGYRITVERSTGLLHRRRSITARGVVVSAGSYGTAELLMRCKARGSLPRLSETIGTYVRTNSEALLGVRARSRNVDHSRGIAITSGVLVDEHTHVEVVRYPRGSDAIALLTTVLTGAGRAPRWLHWLGAILRAPLRALRLLVPFGFAVRSAILLVMQPVDSHLRYRLRRRWWWPFSRKLDSAKGSGPRAPVYLPIANEVAQRLAKKMDGDPQSGLIEVLTNKATTAHILGGCPIGATREDGVVDTHARVFGYERLYIVDGSIIPANLGVNPSLTITAMAEHAMSHVPPKR